MLKLKTIDRYLSDLTTTGLQPESNVYRGQSNSEWKLRSFATRHLSDTRDDIVPIVFVSYHNHILMKARREGFGTEQGRELFDLQLLAELQHFGTPTGLLDFTWNPLIALWFASQDDSEHGKLFSTNSNNPGNVYRILGDEANQDISKIFSRQFNTERPSVSIWEPTLTSTARDRILVQSSVFVICPPQFPNYSDIVSEIEIKKEDKEYLRSELDYLNINEQSLNRDIFGFSEARRAMSIIGEHTNIDKFNQGITYFQQRDFHSAVYIFGSLIDELDNKMEELNSKDAKYYLYSGITNIHLKNYIKAIENFNKYISIGDSNHSAYYYRSAAKYKLKDYIGAIEDCSSAIKIQPNYATAYYNRGASIGALLLSRNNDRISHNDKKQCKKMISYNKKAIKLEPFFVMPYYNLSIAYFYLSKFDKVIKYLTIILDRFDPEHVASYCLRAYAYYEIEKYGCAVQDFTTSTELDPKFTESHHGRACVYYEIKKYEYAIQDFTTAIELNPEFAEAYLGRARANKKLGRNEYCDKDLRKAYQLKPDLAE